MKRATLKPELSFWRANRAMLTATYAISINTVLFFKKLSQISVIYSISIPSSILTMVQLTRILAEVITIAVIINPKNTPESASPLDLKSSIKARNEPVTKVIKQNIMSNK